MRDQAWKHKIRIGDVLNNDDMTFEEKRSEFVKRFCASPAAKDGIHGEELMLLVEELADTTGNDEFNQVWDAIYDLADDGRWLWMEPT